YVFADSTRAGEDSPLAALGRWLDESPESPIRGYTPAGLDENAWFDLKVIYQQDYAAVDIGRVPAVFLPRVGTHRLPDVENVYAALPDRDIFQLRGIDRQGAVVIVRPDQYVANVLPLTATDDLHGFIQTFAARKQCTLSNKERDHETSQNPGRRRPGRGCGGDSIASPGQGLEYRPGPVGVGALFGLRQ